MPALKKNDTVRIADSAKPVADLKGKIVFMIQIATSTRKIETKPANFKNIKDIFELYSGNRFRYASGIFDNYNEAVSYRKKIEAIYPDAFVIAVKDNKIVPLREALDKK